MRNYYLIFFILVICGMMIGYSLAKIQILKVNSAEEIKKILENENELAKERYDYKQKWLDHQNKKPIIKFVEVKR